MRYFIELAYNGTSFCGWQRQIGQISVQQVLEEALTLVQRTPIEVLGCGRTDTGVHAKQYFAHFDCPMPLEENLISRLNRILPESIAIYNIFEVKAEAHARFDAFHRGYEYYITAQKNPFTTQTAYFFPFYKQLDIQKMEEAAKLLLLYDDFSTFCKTNNDAKTMICQLYRSDWKENEAKNGLVYTIWGNRFLRGMVRLIVGMSLNVGLGKVSLEEVKIALENKKQLKNSLSVAPQGLFLTEIRYPDSIYPSPFE